MENEKQHPGFWRLMGAYAIDLPILLWGWFVVMLLIQFLIIFPLMTAGIALGDFLPDVIYIFLLWPFIYFTFCEGLWGKTLGKLIVKVCVQGETLSWWRVLISYVLDIALLGAFCFGATFIIARGERVIDPFGIAGMFMLFGILSFLVYFPLCEHKWGKTLGKKMMGLKVVLSKK